MLKLVRVGTNNKKKAKKQDVIFHLIPDRVFTVGRKGSDLSFEDDTSISRSHARIEIEHPLANLSSPMLVPNVNLTDLGSKFGTFINQGIESGSQVSLQEPNILVSGDRFRFGVQWNEYRIDYIPLIVTTSTIRDLSLLKATIRALCGHLVSEWRQDSDYLVMEGIKLTLKVVSGLMCAKPIVTPAFFTKWYEALEEGLTHLGDYDADEHIPNHNDYLPPLRERALTGNEHLFVPSNSRFELFHEKMFLFVDNKMFKNYSAVITGGGGKVSLLGTASKALVEDASTVLIGDEVVMQAKAEGKIKTNIQLYLTTGKRIVPESEIGLAVVFINISTYTNPNVPKPLRTLSQVSDTQITSSQSESAQSSVMVAETQELSPHAFYTETPLGRSVIEESAVTVKRERDDDEEKEGRNKRRRDDFPIQEQKSPSKTPAKDSQQAKEKRLASLFCMSDDDSEEEVISKPAVSQTVAATQEQKMEVEEDEPKPSSSRYSRRNPRKRAVLLDSDSDFEVPPTQESDEEKIIPSGICPASPEILSPAVSPGPSLPVEPSVRSKRKQGEGDEMQAVVGANDEGNTSKSKRRKVLGELPGKTNRQEEVDERKQNGPNVGDDVQPLGFSFTSLVVSDVRPPTRSSQVVDNGGVNFKRFRKVAPSFAHVPRIIRLISHMEFGVTAAAVAAGVVEPTEPTAVAAAPPPRRGGRRPAQSVQEEAPPAPRPRRRGAAVATSPTKPRARVPTQTNEDDDDFSFH